MAQRSGRRVDQFDRQMAGISKPSLYRAFGNEDGLTLAAIERYGATVLCEIFDILHSGQNLRTTLAALIEYASSSPTMETGCLFYKMRAGKHQPGPKTREKVDEIHSTAVHAFEAFLTARRDAGDWPGAQPADITARYLVEQIGLALTQRATVQDTDQIKASISLALSAITPA